MLKITLHDSSDELRFKLEGKLSGPWVGELRQCWQTAASTTHGRNTILDLREVDFVDPEGQSSAGGDAPAGGAPGGGDAAHPGAGAGNLGPAGLCYG